MVGRIWTAITSVSSAKIILKLLGPLGPTGLFLQLFFFVGVLAYNERNTCDVIKVRN